MGLKWDGVSPIPVVDQVLPVCRDDLREITSFPGVSRGIVQDTRFDLVSEGRLGIEPPQPGRGILEEGETGGYVCSHAMLIVLSACV
jgi:hypothetical protein